MKTIDVTALGELLIDFTESGVSAQGNPLLEVNPGGAPCNVLSMLSRLGRKTEFIGKVGQDMFGDLLEDAVRSAGIGTAGLLRDPEVNTTLAFVHTGPGGERSFSFYRNPGADRMLCKEDLKERLLTETKIFHFGTLSMTHPECRAATKEAIRLAETSGALISFDPNLREPLWEDLEIARQQVDYGLRHCQILKISDNEIRWFTGEMDYDAAVSRLLEHYPIPLLLLSLGKDGSRAFCGGRSVQAAAFLNPDTIETTGAGDTFDACILHFILQKMENDPAGNPLDLRECELTDMLTFANAAASIVTTRKGALKVMPKLQEIEAVLKTK